MQEYDYTRDDVETDVQEEGGRKRHADGGQHNGQRDAKMRRSKVTNKPTLKVLVPNLAVGKLIGKGGANINELENKHSASIEVSPSKDFFPGTNNRTVTVSADIEQIIEFAKYMIEEVQEDGAERGRPQEFSIVITNSAVGFVMGRGGATIKVIQEESGAGINIQKQSESSSPGERLVTITGSNEQKTKAAEQIIEKMSVEPQRMSNTNTKYGDYNPNYGAPRHGSGDYPAPKYGGGGATLVDHLRGGFNLSSTLRADPYASVQSDSLRYPIVQDEPARFSVPLGALGLGVPNYESAHAYYEPKCKAKTSHLIQMEIPNSMVGSIVGKGGVTINGFSNSSGAQISFSGKEEFAPGTQDRILTIKGRKNQVHNAYMMIDSKVAEVEADFRRGPAY